MEVITVKIYFMEGTLYKEMIALVFGGILGALLKYWWDYRGMVHKELWGKRYEEYKKMFVLAGNFPLYPRKASITYQKLSGISEEMRDWFFNHGGLLLSKKTRNKYFKVQKENQVTLIANETKDKNTEISDAEYDTVRILFSQFRRAMTDDLMSRTRM
jgi:hypothetical protein